MGIEIDRNRDREICLSMFTDTDADTDTDTEDLLYLLSAAAPQSGLIASFTVHGCFHAS